MMFEPEFQSSLIAAIVTLLVASVFVYFAARFVLDRSSIIASVLTAFFASFLALVALMVIPGVWGLVVGIAVWALVAAAFFRAKWVQGAIIGLVAWLLWILVNLLIDYLMRQSG